MFKICERKCTQRNNGFKIVRGILQNIVTKIYVKRVSFIYTFDYNPTLNFSHNFPDRIYPRERSLTAAINPRIVEEARATLVKYARESIHIGLIPSPVRKLRSTFPEFHRAPVRSLYDRCFRWSKAQPEQIHFPTRYRDHRWGARCELGVYACSSFYQRSFLQEPVPRGIDRLNT